MQPMVEVTDKTFVERKLLEFQCNLAYISDEKKILYVHIRNHSWVSFQGFAEAYNDTFSVKMENGNVVYESMPIN